LRGFLQQEANAIESRPNVIPKAAEKGDLELEEQETSHQRTAAANLPPNDRSLNEGSRTRIKPLASHYRAAISSNGRDMLLLLFVS
jgi:hypothetical protein